MSVNLEEIEEHLKINKQFHNEQINIKKTFLDDENKVYLAEFYNKNKICYSGYLNFEFIRNSFGKYIYENNDIYLGYWKGNLKNGEGILLYSSGEVYIGNWKEGCQQEEGLYIWKFHKDSDFELEAFIGNFENNIYRRGLYISRLRNKFSFETQDTTTYIYFGEFTNDGKKSDHSSFFYEYERNILFYGKINNNKIESGYQISFSSDDYNFDDLINFTMSQSDERIIEIKKKEAMWEDESQAIIGKCKVFIDTFINDKNIFNEVLDLYQLIIEYTSSDEIHLIENKLFQNLAGYKLLNNLIHQFFDSL